MCRSLVVAPMAILLVACESYEWQRPATTAAAAEEDVRYCREEARIEANRSYGILGGRGGWGSPQRNRLTDFCMRNRGYTAVKVGSNADAGSGR